MDTSPTFAPLRFVYVGDLLCFVVVPFLLLSFCAIGASFA